MKSGDFRLYADKNRELKANIEKIFGALGLAMRAGGLAVGNEAVNIAITKNKARIVFITSDISDNSKEKLLSKIILSETKYIVLPCTMSELAKRLGKSGYTSAAALVRPGFEKIIFKAIDKAIPVKSNDNNTEVQ